MWRTDYYEIIERLRRDICFAFNRFCDGEWMALFKETGKKISGDTLVIDDLANQLVTDALLKSKLDDENYILGMDWISRKYYLDRIITFSRDNNLSHLQWKEAQILHLAIQDGILWPFLQELKKQPIFIIGPSYLKELRLFDVEKYFEIPEKNCHLVYKEILKELLKFSKQGIYLFSASILSKYLIANLYNKIKNASFLDCGSIWDPFLEKKTRTYMRLLKEETLKANLEAPLATGCLSWDYPLYHEILQRQILKGKKFRISVDVGAHVGTWTMDLAKISQRVYAFEPQLVFLESFKKNLEKQNIKNVTIITKAVGKELKNSPVEILADWFGQRKAIASSLTTLDAELKNEKEGIDFIKIDVEGAEIDVLDGGKEILKQKPALFIECHSKENYNEVKRRFSSFFEIAFRKLSTFPLPSETH